jgi:hypothetical protein
MLSYGRIAQLVRAPALQAGGRRFKPCFAHQLTFCPSFPCGFPLGTKSVADEKNPLARVLELLVCLASCKPVVEPVGKGVPGRHACFAQQTLGYAFLKSSFE